MTLNARGDRRDRQIVTFVGAVALAALTMTVILIAVQRTYFFSQSNWAIFGLFSALLVLGETQPSFAMRFGDNGEVSPGWTFAFALMLFGMPIGALLVMVASNLIVDIRLHNPARMVIFNVSQIALALSAGALVLQLFGLRGSMTQLDTIPVQWGLGILAAAATVLILNGVLTATVIGLHTGAGFVATFRTGLALSMTADGALLSLAPVFVIAVDYSFVLVPLLATTSYIVIRSARNSLQRAHDANHDPLTGLLNRRAFDDRLTRTLGVGGDEQQALLLVMDFDRFKEINDSLGHAIGDALLSSFADRLHASIPATASAARFGGDEFAVVIPGEMPATATTAIVGPPPAVDGTIRHPRFPTLDLGQRRCCRGTAGRHERPGSVRRRRPRHVSGQAERGRSSAPSSTWPDQRGQRPNRSPLRLGRCDRRGPTARSLPTPDQPGDR